MERDSKIDIAKGLGEILVCIGHSKFSSYFEVKFIYQFHMPLFFILSGMLINIEKYSVLNFIKKKMETILFPYYTISLFSLFNSINYDKNFNYKKYFLQTLKGRQEGKSYWFIHCLFISQCLTFIFLKFISFFSKNNKKFKNLLVFFLIFLSNYYGYYFASFKHTYYRINLTLLIISYILAGYLIKLNRFFFDYYFFNIFFSPFYIYYFYKNVNKNSFVSYNKSLVGNIYYSNLLSYLGIFFIFSLSNFIKSNSILEYFGKNSLYVYFLNVENKNYFDNLTLFFGDFIPKNINSYFRHLILLGINIFLILIKIAIFIQIFQNYFPWFLNFSYFYKIKLKNLLNNKNKNKILN